MPTIVTYNRHKHRFSKVFFLDRNAIGTAQYLLTDKFDLNDYSEENVENLKKYHELKHIDVEGHLISGFFSAIEGSAGRVESIVEKKRTIKQEAEILRRFFSNAKTDNLDQGSEIYLPKDSLI